MTDNPSTAGSDRRGLLLAVAGCVVAATVLLLASEQEWLRLSLPAQPPLPGESQKLTGQEVVDSLVPVGIVIGAAGLALIAARRIGRLVVAVVLVVAGLLLMALIGFFLYDDGSSVAYSWAQAYAEPGESAFPARDVSVLPAVVALLAGGIPVAVGCFTLARGRWWPVMGVRFERRTSLDASGEAAGPSRSGTAERCDPRPAVSEAAMWAALERGEDPTISPTQAGTTAAPAATRDQSGPRP
ncbi:MAG: Trp biosynthesis-associated membrane protein [Actinomycetota bacterium]|nr:Trp biosynthesis-associated membrane protein [Actinomycetota bacterium]